MEYAVNQDHQWKDSNASSFFFCRSIFQSNDQWQKEMNRPNSPREEVFGRYLWEAESRKKDIVCLVLTPKPPQKILQSSLSQSVVDPGTQCRWVLDWNSSQGCCSLCLQRSVGDDCSKFAQEGEVNWQHFSLPSSPWPILCSQDLQTLWHSSHMKATYASPPLPKGNL